MDSICFAYPGRLPLLLLLLPLSVILGWGVWRKFRARKSLADDKLAVKMLGIWNPGREIAIRAVQLLAVCLLLVASCGPQLCSGEKLVRRAALDIAYVLDVSNSMLARDVVPDRLGKARLEILRVSRGIDSGRRGLVAFAGSAVVQCPLTTDRQAFETMLNIASPDLVEEQGTNLSAALAMADRILSVSSGTGRSAGARAVVLVTDGEDHGEAFSGAVRRLRERNTQLIVIGVGKERPAVIPLRDTRESNDSVMLDADGNPVMTSFRPKLLGLLAEQAGGLFFPSREPELVFRSVLEALETSGGDTQWVREPRYREEVYHYFLFASVLLLGAGVLGARY